MKAIDTQSAGNFGNLNEPVIKRAVVAAAFSPRLAAVMNEAHRVLKSMGAWPIIVHVGEETPATRIRLEEAIDRSDFRDHPPICIIRNGNAVDVLMDVAREYQADLIIAGALKREALFKYYLGSIARKIARQSPCSVLLFTEPQVKPEPIHKIHAAVEYDSQATLSIQVAAQLKYFLNTKELFFTHTFSQPDYDKKTGADRAQKIKKVFAQEDQKLKDYLNSFELWDIPYHTRCLLDKSQDVTLNFTRDIAADLFIVNGPRAGLGLWDRLFPQELERTLQNLPCSILITRS